MIVAVDVGNTHTVIGLFDNDQIVDTWRVSTDTKRTSDEWMALFIQLLSVRQLQLIDIEALVLGSVVPSVTTAFRRMCERANIWPLVVTWETDTGMPILIDEPKEMGADRIADAVAGHATYGGPLIIVDMGTATTFDVVSANGEHLGGVIMPGVQLSLDALFKKAASLRRIELFPPEKVVGKNTADAMRAGATIGYATQIDGVCDRIEREIGPARVISTGGLSTGITPLSERITQHDPWLTLRGLHMIYKRTTK